MFTMNFNLKNFNVLYVFLNKILVLIINILNHFIFTFGKYILFYFFLVKNQALTIGNK